MTTIQLDTGPVLTQVAAVGCGAMGGVFFAFSAFVMPAFARLPAAGAVAAMQSVNTTAVRPALMTGLFGTAAVTGVLALSALRHLGDRRAVLLLVGAGLYLIGTIALTAVWSVPLNDALATVDPTGAGAAGEWAHYLSRWTAANHVRTVAALGAAAAFTAALRV